MDIIRAITFIPEEDRWIEKLAIGVGVLLVSSVLSIILIGFLGFLIVAGYTVRLLQNVRDGKEQVLPEWNEWSGDLKRGFKLLIVMIVWTLAVWIFMIPLVVGGVMSDSGSGFIQFMGAMLTLTASCFMMLYGIFIVLAQPGVSIAFAEDEQIRSGLALSKVWTWTRANLGQVIIAAIAVVVASFIIGAAGMLVGSLLCLVGLVLTVPLATLVTYIYQFHLYGQLAREHPIDGSAPITEAETGPDASNEQVAGLLDEKTNELSESVVEDEAPAAGVDEPSVGELDTKQPDVEQSDAEQADVAQPDTDVSDTEQSDVAQPDTDLPDAEQPDAEEPNV